MKIKKEREEFEKLKSQIFAAHGIKPVPYVEPATPLSALADTAPVTLSEDNRTMHQRCKAGEITQTEYNKYLAQRRFSVEKPPLSLKQKLISGEKSPRQQCLAGEITYAEYKKLIRKPIEPQPEKSFYKKTRDKLVKMGFSRRKPRMMRSIMALHKLKPEEQLTEKDIRRFIAGKDEVVKGDIRFYWQKVLGKPALTPDDPYAVLKNVNLRQILELRKQKTQNVLLDIEETIKPIARKIKLNPYQIPNDLNGNSNLLNKMREEMRRCGIAETTVDKYVFLTYNFLKGNTELTKEKIEDYVSRNNTTKNNGSVLKALKIFEVIYFKKPAIFCQHRNTGKVSRINETENMRAEVEAENIAERKENFCNKLGCEVSICHIDCGFGQYCSNVRSIANKKSVCIVKAFPAVQGYPAFHLSESEEIRA